MMDLLFYWLMVVDVNVYIATCLSTCSVWKGVLCLIVGIEERIVMTLSI